MIRPPKQYPRQLFVDRIGQRYYVPQPWVAGFKGALSQSLQRDCQMRQHALEHGFGRFIVDGHDMKRLGIEDSPLNQQGSDTYAQEYDTFYA